MSRDLATRSRDIHWSEGFSPELADLFSHNELRIGASCERFSVGIPLHLVRRSDIRVSGSKRKCLERG